MFKLLFPTCLRLFSIVLVIGLLSSSLTEGQNIPYERVSTRGGLGSDIIRKVFLDSRGILWIGSEFGVSRYTYGNSINYQPKAGQQAFTNCWAIVEAPDGAMWMGSYGQGLMRIQDEEQSFFRTAEGLVDDFVTELAIWEDKLLVGTQNGVSILSWQQENPRVLQVQGSVIHRDGANVSGFLLHEGQAYFSTYARGLFRIDKTEGGYRAVPVHNGNRIYSLFAHQEKVYVATKEGVLVYEAARFFQEGAKPMVHLPAPIVWDFFADHSGQLYGASWGIHQNNGGLIRIHADTVERVDRYAWPSRNFKTGLFDPRHRRFIMGSLTDGLYIAPEKSFLFTFSLQEGGRRVKGMTELGGTLFVLQDQGLQWSDGFIDARAFKDFQRLAYGPSLQQELARTPSLFALDNQTPAEDLVFYRIESDADRLLIATNIGMFQLDGNGQFRDYLPLHTYHFTSVPEGGLLEANPYGGIRYLPDFQLSNSQYYPEEAPKTPTFITDLSQRGAHTYFASIFTGVYRFSLETGPSPLRSDLPEVASRLKRIRALPEGQLLLGTESGEVFWVKEQGSDSLRLVHHFPASQLQGNGIYYVDAFEDLILIGTEKGLHLIAEDQQRFISGTSDKTESFHPYYRHKQHVYMGGDGFYFELDLNTFKNQKNSPLRISITSFTHEDEELFPNAYSWFTLADQEYALASGQNNLSISFTAIDHPHPQYLRYSYRLDGTEAWKALGERQTINLSNVQSGQYNLELLTVDLLSGTEETLSILRFSIAPPFYQRWWFLVSLVLTFVGITAMIYQKRAEILKNKTKLEREVLIHRLDALKNQMNPHFTFNVLNTLLYFIIGGKKQEAADMLGNFATLLRTTLEHSAQEEVSLKDMMELLKRYAAVENQRYQDAVRVQIHHAPGLDPATIKVPPLLIQPFVENTFKHAFGGDYTKGAEVEVYFQEQGNRHLLVTIRDNGRGFRVAETKSTSMGMRIVTQRLSLFPEFEPHHLQVESIPGKGTLISVLIPRLDQIALAQK
ncbi:MAG: sensor histidine kinase [Nitritalea sp.]